MPKTSKKKQVFMAFYCDVFFSLSAIEADLETISSKLLDEFKVFLLVLRLYVCILLV